MEQLREIRVQSMQAGENRRSPVRCEEHGSQLGPPTPEQRLREVAAALGIRPEEGEVVTSLGARLGVVPRVREADSSGERGEAQAALLRELRPETEKGVEECAASLWRAASV